MFSYIWLIWLFEQIILLFSKVSRTLCNNYNLNLICWRETLLLQFFLLFCVKREMQNYMPWFGHFIELDNICMTFNSFFDKHWALTLLHTIRTSSAKPYLWFWITLSTFWDISDFIVFWNCYCKYKNFCKSNIKNIFKKLRAVFFKLLFHNCFIEFKESTNLKKVRQRTCKFMLL